jgi:cell shape-determining protein MreC
VLLGKTTRVFDTTSLVQTVFDDGWQSAVRVGRQGTDALLKGGSNPRLTLIGKTARIATGDIVYSASERFPYGLSIASVKDVKLSADRLFQEAELQFDYDLNDIRAVSVFNNNAK